MSGVQVEVTMSDIDVEREIDALISAGLSRRVMRNISRTLKTESDEFFEDEQAPDGTPWIKSGRAIAEGGAVLQDSGILARSITSDYGGGFASVGSNLPYARIHQLGGKAGRNRSVTIPARPYLGLSIGGEADVEDHVLAALRQLGAAA